MKKGRKKLWVDREIQLRFVIYTIIVLGIACIIVSSSSFYSVWTNIISKVLKAGDINTIYTHSLKRFVVLNLGLISFLALLSALGMILVSHKIAGPAYRIRRTLKELQEGKEVDFKLRKGDALNPLAEEFEKFAEHYRQLKNSGVRVIEVWKNTEVKDISLNLALKELENKIITVYPVKREGKMKKGFSLIETLILTFIAVTLGVLIVGLVSNSREFAKALTCVNNMRNISQAIENYQIDWKNTPSSLEDLMPQYITNPKIFHCPNDKKQGNSYEKFYVARHFYEDDTNKLFLVCNRHYKGKKTVVSYLSYAVDIGKTQKVYWNGIPVDFGQEYKGGNLTFVDGTKVSSSSSTEVGVLTSFSDSEGKIYSVIYVPEGEDASLNVNHNGDSEFEVITPAVIAGVEGTKFTLRNYWLNTNPPSCRASVSVAEGEVKVEERSQGRRFNIKKGKKLLVEIRRWLKEIKHGIPRKPPKQRPHIWFYDK